MENWDNLNTFLILMEPFQDITKIVCQDDAFLSNIVVIMSGLKMTLEKLKAKVNFMELKLIDSFLYKIPLRFSIYENSVLVIKITFIDP